MTILPKSGQIILFSIFFYFLTITIPPSVLAVCNIDNAGTYIEAEDFTGSELVGGSDSDHKFSIVNDTDVNGDKYLQAGNDADDKDKPGDEIKEYEVNFTSTGTYYIWMRGERSSGSDNEMFYGVDLAHDDSGWEVWKLEHSDWRWIKGTISISTTGVHTVKIAMKEDNVRIDGFYVTTGSETPNDSTVPSSKTSIDPTSSSCTTTTGGGSAGATICEINEAGTYIEAENFTSEAPINNGTNDRLTIVNDNDANGGKALRSGTSGGASNTPNNDVKIYKVNFPVSSTYYFWMRGEGYSGSKDSMFFTVDNKTWKAWNFGGRYNNYVWTDSMQVNAPNSIYVTAGTHDIKIAMREDDTRIDGFYITTGSETPTDSTVPSQVTPIDPNNCSPAPTMSVNPSSLGPTNFVGFNAAATSITLTNTGLLDLAGGAITSSAPWLSISTTSIADPFSITDSLTINVTYSTNAMSAGTYNASITFTAASASNTPLIIPVTLIVKGSPSTAACGEVPLYAENLVNPAIMVQLDTSGSMSSSMYILANGKNPATPDLSTIVQEIVSLPAWQLGNSMGFIISGSGRRRAWSYNGQANGAPKLYITYTNNAISGNLENRVIVSADDVQIKNSSLNTTQTYLEFGRNNNPVGIRFTGLNIPAGSTINSAVIKFVIYSGDSTTTNLTINGALVDDFSTFTLNAFTTDPINNPLTSSIAWNNIESWNNTMSRIDIAEDVLKEVFRDQSISWGFATWAGGSCNSSNSRSDDYTNYRIGCHTPDDAHMASLQLIADDGSASGCTPLAPTMNAGLDYFTSTRQDNHYNEFFQSLTCQPRILVIVTDGLGNTGTTLSLVEARINALIAEGISVVAVGFGIDNAVQIEKIASLAQAAGKVSDTDYLYPLHEEDASGVGLPFLAQSREDFINALNSIVTNVKAQIFHGAAPAPTTSVDTGEVLITATFDASDWTGDLTSTSFDAYTGQLSQSETWSAENLMPIPINAFIYDGLATDKVSIYTDVPGTVGVDLSLTSDNYLCKSFGDIINSTPKIVSSPPFQYSFDGYNTSTFKYNTDVINRDHMVYVGANDGALHAFNLVTGVEKWRFYPDSIKAKLNLAGIDPTKDMCSPAYCHQFMVDGSPLAADIYNGSSWKTILLTGLGEGGTAFFNLDVTYGNDFTPSTDSSNATLTPSAFLWEFNELDDSNIGLATSDPTVDRIASTTMIGDTLWATFFGSGPAVNEILQASKESYVFGLNAWDKSMIWKDTDNATTNNTYSVKLVTGTLLNDVPSPILSIDTEADDNKYDHLYTGNLYGDMYRISNISEGNAPIVTKFFDSTNVDRSTPITTKAGFAFSGDPDHDDNYDIWLYFGTGRYHDGIDKVSSIQQYFFGLKDSEGSTPAYTMADLYPSSAGLTEGYALDTNSAPVDLNGDGIINSNDLKKYRTITCSDATCNSSHLSWVVSLFDPNTNPSERIVAQPLVVGGIVFFTTFIPDGNVCEGNGDAYLFALDWETGAPPSTPVFDLNQDQVFDKADRTFRDSNGIDHDVAGIYLGIGKPSEPVLHNNILFVGTTGQPPTPIKVNITDLNAKLKAWKQDFN